MTMTFNDDEKQILSRFIDHPDCGHSDVGQTQSPAYTTLQKRGLISPNEKGHWILTSFGINEINISTELLESQKSEKDR